VETENNIYGVAKNPWNEEKTAGGSSGGDAGMVASRCVPFGIGSDLGGSIRIPCDFCGVYGFKITNARSSIMNQKIGHPSGVN